MRLRSSQIRQAGSARVFILVGLGGLLLAAAVLLWLVLGAGASTADEADGEEVVEVPPPPPPASGPQLVVRPTEPPPGAGGSMLKSAQRVHKLMGHLHKGAKSEDELAKKGPGSRIKVTVTGPPSPPDGMNPDIWAHMNEVLPRFSRCYQQRLLEKPGLKGKLVLSLSLSLSRVPGEGHATASGDIHKDSTIKDFKLQQCVLKRLAVARFPAPLAETKERATYPIVLQPGTGPASVEGPVAPRLPAKEEPKGAPPHPPSKEDPRGAPPHPPSKEEPKGSPPPPHPPARGEPAQPPPDPPAESVERPPPQQ